MRCMRIQMTIPCIDGSESMTLWQEDDLRPIRHGLRRRRGRYSHKVGTGARRTRIMPGEYSESLYGLCMAIVSTPYQDTYTQ